MTRPIDEEVTTPAGRPQELVAGDLTGDLERLAARWRARGDERCADELEAALAPNGGHAR